jgi:hypothetical protein
MRGLINLLRFVLAVALTLATGEFSFAAESYLAQFLAKPQAAEIAGRRPI